jgi:hypothetical protein
MRERDEKTKPSKRSLDEDDRSFIRRRLRWYMNRAYRGYEKKTPRIDQNVHEGS